MKICRVCRTYMKDKAPAGHHETIVSLIRSVSTGCHFCTEFWESFPVEAKTQLEMEIEPDLHLGKLGRSDEFIGCQCTERGANMYFAGWPHGTYFFILSIQFDTWKRVFSAAKTNPAPHHRWYLVPDLGYAKQIQSQEMSLPVHAPPSIPAPQPLILRTHNTVLSSYTCSNEALHVAMTWINACLDTHEACQNNTTESWLPTRLLDIKKHGIIRLKPGEDISPRWRYNTLSHCWGDSDFLQLNQRTAMALETGIADNLLPPTFQDAIGICRILGVRYLWIDSLCIQQDDFDDWLRESRQMDKIYSSSYCNIAATASSSNKHGMFRIRDTKRLEPATFRESSPVMRAGAYRVIREDYYSTEVHEAPLHKRAWVFQERFLAKRILHFSEHELMWECQSLIASESWPGGIPGPRRARFKNLTTLDQHENWWESHGQERNADAGWREVARLFSRTRLTYADDRILAIAGIAKAFRRLLNDQYVVGMWKRTLVSDLLWGVNSQAREPRQTKSSLPRPPSFSWLSVESSIRWQSDQNISAAQVIDIVGIHLEYLTDDDTGPVKFGEIHLRGYLVEIQLAPGKVMYYDTMCRDWKVTISGTVLPCMVAPDFGREHLPTGTKNREHFLLPCSRRAKHWMQGLMLEAVDLEACVFRRIGMFMVGEESGHRDQLLLARRYNLRTNKSSYPSSVYDEETGRCTILIR